MEDSYFVVDDKEMLNFHEEEYYKKLMSKDLKWGFWQEVRYYEEIQVPPQADCYNGPRVLKYDVSNRFNTTLQCISKCTQMNIFLLDTHSNK